MPGADDDKGGCSSRLTEPMLLGGNDEGGVSTPGTDLIDVPGIRPLFLGGPDLGRQDGLKHALPPSHHRSFSPCSAAHDRVSLAASPESVQVRQQRPHMLRPVVTKLPLSALESSSSQPQFIKTVSGLVDRVLEPLPVNEQYQMGLAGRCRARFPLRLVLKVLIIGLLYTEVLRFVKPRNEYVRTHHHMLTKAFLPSDDALSEDLNTISRSLRSLYHEHDFYDVSYLVAFIRETVENYYALPLFSPGLLQHYSDPDNTSAVLHPVMVVGYVKMNGTLLSHPSDAPHRIEEHVYQLSRENPLGPFASVANYTGAFSGSIGTANMSWGKAPTAIRHDCHPSLLDHASVFPCRAWGLDVFDKVDYIHVHLSLRSLMMQSQEFPNMGSISWSLKQVYDFSKHHGAVPLTLETTSHLDNSGKAASEALILAIASFVASVLSVVVWVRVAQDHARHRGDTLLSLICPCFRPRKWCAPSDLSSLDDSASSLFGALSPSTFTVTWGTLHILTDALTAVEGGLRMYYLTHPVVTGGFWHTWITVLGFAVLLESLAVLSFLRMVPSCYVTIKALRAGLPNLLRFAVSMTPIFFGYAMCGTALFGSYVDEFATLQRSMVTLFSTINQDRIMQLLNNITESDSSTMRVCGSLFVVTFVAIMVFASLNIMLSIVQDGYFFIKERYTLWEERLETMHRVLSGEPEHEGEEGCPSTARTQVNSNEQVIARINALVAEVARLQATLQRDVTDTSSHPPLPAPSRMGSVN